MTTNPRYALYAWKAGEEDALRHSYEDTETQNLAALRKKARQMIANGAYAYVGIWGWNATTGAYDDLLDEFP